MDVIVLSTVLEEVKKRNTAAYTRLRAICGTSNQPRRVAAPEARPLSLNAPLQDGQKSGSSCLPTSSTEKHTASLPLERAPMTATTAPSARQQLGKRPAPCNALGLGLGEES